MVDKEKKHHKLLWSIIIVVIVLLVGGGGTGYYLYHQQQVAINKAKEKKIALKIKKYNDYVIKIDTAVSDINSAYQSSQPVIKNYKEAWQYYIEHGTWWDKELDMPQLVLDVGDVFDFTKQDMKSDVDVASGDNSSLSNAISELNNPPKELQNITSKITDLYGEYQTYYSLADDPNSVDSYYEYSKQSSELSSQIETDYNQIKASMPDVKPTKVTKK